MNFNKSTWIKVQLSDVVTKKEESDRDNAHKRFNRFLKVDHMDAESLHIKRWASQDQGDEINPTFYKIFRKGQILFPTRNPHLRRTALASFDGICGEKTLTLEPNSDVILPEFIPFLFHSESFYAHTTSSIIGSTNPHCRWRDVANYDFLLPPKAQQAEIAELLWAMDEVTQNEISLLNSSCLLKKSMLKSSFRRELCDRWKVSDISLNIDNRRIPIKSSERKKGPIPYYGASGIVDNVKGFIFDEPILLISEDGENLNSRKLPIAYSVDGKCWVNNHAHVLSVTKASRYLVMEYFNFADISGFISGGTRPKITKGILSDMPIYLPKKKFSDDVKGRLLKIDESTRNSREKISSSKSLQKSLINQVF